MLPRGGACRMEIVLESIELNMLTSALISSVLRYAHLLWPP